MRFPLYIRRVRYIGVPVFDAFTVIRDARGVRRVAQIDSRGVHCRRVHRLVHRDVVHARDVLRQVDADLPVIIICVNVVLACLVCCAAYDVQLLAVRLRDDLRLIAAVVTRKLQVHTL